MILDLILSKNTRQQKATAKQYDKFITKHQGNEPLNKRLTQKKEIKNKAASKIIKLYRNSLKFEIVDRQEAFKNKVKQITVKPSFIGSSMATDLDAFVARSYVIARREIPKNAEFKRQFGNQKPNEDFIIKSYANFVKNIRTKYPSSSIICVLGNMDATKEGSKWPEYVKKAVENLQDKKIYTHFFKYKNTAGHPNVSEQKDMANSLIAFINEKIKW